MPFKITVPPDSPTARAPFSVHLHAGVPEGHDQRQRRLPLPASPTSHRRRPHRTQPPHWPRHRRHLPHPPLRLRAERPFHPGYRLGWARVPPFQTHPNRPAAPLHRRRLPRLPPTGTTYGAPHPFPRTPHLRRAYCDPRLHHRTACRHRECRREHRSSSRLGFHAVRRLSAAHHWRHDTSPSRSDIFSDPPSRRRCRGNPSAYSRLPVWTPTATRRTQTIYTRLPCDPAPDRGPAKTSSHDDASSHSPRATRTIDATQAIGAQYPKSDPFNNALPAGTNTTVSAPSGARRRTR